MATTQDESDNYTRQYLDHQAQILESVCNNCGLVLVGCALHAVHGLREKEIKHTVECPRSKRNGTS